MSTAGKSRRRWFRFSLRTAFVLVTALCVWLGILVSNATKQRDLVGRLAKTFDQHASHPLLQVAYDYQWDANNQPTGVLRPPGPEWLHNLLGVDFFQTVIGLDLDGATDAELRDLHKLHKLRWLNLGGEFSDAELTRLTGHQHLTTLSLDLSYSTAVTDRGLAFLGELENLTSLALSVSNSISDAGLQPLRLLVNLKELNLTFDGEQGEGVLAHVSTLPRLKKLRIQIERGESQVNDGLAHLSAAGTLETLVLSRNFPGPPKGHVPPCNLAAISSLRRLSLGRWSGQSLDYLAALNHLEELTVWDGQDLSAIGLRGLHALPWLRAVSLDQCDKVTLEGLKGNTILQELTVWNCEGISSTGLSALDSLPSLRQLTLAHCSGISLEGLKGCPSLQELKVVLCDTRSDDLPHLGDLPNLRKLVLGGSSNLSLQSLTAMPSLEELEISRCRRLLDSDAARLLVIPGLKHLHMELYAPMTDASLVSISQLRKLESLVLYLAPDTSDSGISQLASLTHLKRLEISGRTHSKVSVEAIEKLRKALPQCQIESDP